MQPIGGEHWVYFHNHMQSKSNTSTLWEDPAANQTYSHTNRGSNQGLSIIRTSEKQQNIHSGEAAAATNQSDQTAVVETTRLQDPLPSCCVALKGIPQVTAEQA